MWNYYVRKVQNTLNISYICPETCSRDTFLYIYTHTHTLYIKRNIPTSCIWQVCWLISKNFNITHICLITTSGYQLCKSHFTNTNFAELKHKTKFDPTSLWYPCTNNVLKICVYGYCYLIHTECIIVKWRQILWLWKYNSAII